MKKTRINIIAMLMLLTVSSSAANLLLEAESFKDKGGWVLDSQFSLQMGSPYLLAHGLGEPVLNAKTTVEFPEKGMYHVWVRTKNWAPGNWKAPGIFKIVINGTEIPKELGTEKSWTWQYVKKVSIKKLESTVELKDLTGFDGRCDAIYFSTKNLTPPNDNKELAKWRNEKRYKDKQLVDEKQFDLVVVGGGIAGCGAAIAAAEEGLNVALIHDRPVLGGNASSEVRVHTLGITWKYDRILSKLNTQHWENGSDDAKIDELKRMNNMKSYKNIHLFLQYQAFNCQSANNSIQWVDAKELTTNKTVRFRAPLFADCTGDGWIGYWAGAEFMYGREPSTTFNENYSELKDRITTHFAIKDTINDPHKTIIAESKDGKVMGATLLWSTKNCDKPYQFPAVPWA
ncbi:MAG: FAD-dependent oxidoreductase, partial [Paludibacter sp.]